MWYCGEYCNVLNKNPFINNHVPLTLVVLLLQVVKQIKVVEPVHISNVWSIDLELAKQNYADSGLSQKFPTKDQMLWPKYINSHLFIDTSFVKGTFQCFLVNIGPKLTNGIRL